VAAFDPATGDLVWGETEAGRLESRGSVAPRTLGEESWKWLFLQPLLTQE
jgi:phospholipid/cholesterol/gamma-HCH transport system substrate-binding protein